MNRQEWNEHIEAQPLPTHSRVLGNDAQPLPIRAWELEEVRRLRAKLLTDTEVRDGFLFWVHSGNLVPAHVLGDDARMEVPAEQQAEDTRRLKAFVTAYCANPPKLSDEARAEALHELGPDAVNIITGERLFKRG